jgi:hypothetical protein
MISFAAAIARCATAPVTCTPPLVHHWPLMPLPEAMLRLRRRSPPVPRARPGARLRSCRRQRAPPRARRSPPPRSSPCRGNDVDLRLRDVHLGHLLPADLGVQPPFKLGDVLLDELLPAHSLEYEGGVRTRFGDGVGVREKRGSPGGVARPGINSTSTGGQKV